MTHDPFGTNPAANRRPPSGVSDLTANGLSVSVHMPKALTSQYGRDGEEIEQGLPPSALRQAVNVDDCEHVPEGWVRSNGDNTVASYLVASKTGHGLWIDLNANAHHPHYVAAVISIQGVNAITGQPVTGQNLEQYRLNCPVHGTPFGPKRNCSRCGFNWEPQNYFATTGTPEGYFWLDGFCAEPGKAIRQFVFTEQVERGIAAQVIGEARSQAIGVSFYLSVDPKPIVRREVMRGGGGFEGLRSFSPKSIEVAAGARVKQFVHPDPKPLDFWQTEPAATIRIYYATPDEARAIAGLLPPASRDGFMTSLRHGHHPDPFSA